MDNQIQKSESLPGRKVFKDSLAMKAYFYDGMTRKERTAAFLRMERACMVTRHTIYNWCYGLCRIPALHKAKIEEIFGARIFDMEDTACTADSTLNG